MARSGSMIRIILIQDAGSLCIGLFLGGIFIPMLITIIILLAAISDIKSGKIPNFLIGCGIAIGGAKVIWIYGLVGLWIQGINLLQVFLPLFVLYLLRLLGAGDVKLISVIWLYLGTNQERLRVIWLSFFVAALMSLFAVVTRLIKGEVVRRTPIRLGPAFLLGWLIYLGGSYCV